jgi:hypothetical protein
VLEGVEETEVVAAVLVDLVTEVAVVEVEVAAAVVEVVAIVVAGLAAAAEASLQLVLHHCCGIFYMAPRMIYILAIFKVLLLLFGPTVIRICLLFLLLIHNCPMLFSVENVDGN